MKQLFAIADQYVQESDWKVLAALKFCLFSMGVWVGSFLTGKAEKPVRKVCVLVFWVTYIPLLLKLAQVVYRSLKRREAGPEL